MATQRQIPSPILDPSEGPHRVQTPPPSDAVDLTAASKVVGGHAERRAWLQEMLAPGGMAPGTSSRAHARAFRFADALRRVGYQVSEGPFGPRGGRRFILDGYDGPRAGELFRLQEGRSCGLRHPPAACDCFDALTDEGIKFVRKLHRSLAKTRGIRYGTDQLARLVDQYDREVITLAVSIYINTHRSPGTGATLEELLEAVLSAQRNGPA